MIDLINQVVRRWHPKKEPRDVVIELAKHLNKPSIVLDIGCGRGRHLSYLSDHGCVLIATDIVPEAIDHCNQMLHREKKKIYFVRNDCNSLSFRPESFDAVVATNSLHYNILPNFRLNFE